MKAPARRTHVVLRPELVSAIDAVVGKRGRSRFLVQAAERELKRLAQARALSSSAGAWRAIDHPELSNGAAVWVKRRRSESNRRLGRTRR